eukprot:g46290.t1
MSLTLTIRMTKVLQQPGPVLWSQPPIIKIYKETLENVDHFQYLRSILSAKATIDEETQHGLQCASVAFGHLRKRVFENNNIRSDIKLMVYTALVVPAFRYGSEIWTVYSRHFKALEQYRQCYL